MARLCGCSRMSSCVAAEMPASRTDHRSERDTGGGCELRESVANVWIWITYHAVQERVMDARLCRPLRSRSTQLGGTRSLRAPHHRAASTNASFWPTPDNALLREAVARPAAAAHLCCWQTRQLVHGASGAPAPPCRPGVPPVSAQRLLSVAAALAAAGSRRRRRSHLARPPAPQGRSMLVRATRQHTATAAALLHTIVLQAAPGSTLASEALAARGSKGQPCHLLPSNMTTSRPPHTISMAVAQQQQCCGAATVALVGAGQVARRQSPTSSASEASDVCLARDRCATLALE